MISNFKGTISRGRSYKHVNPESHELVPLDLKRISSLILVIRGQRVMLDRDLAPLYGAAVGAFNQAVRRNLARFPPDFMLELDETETRQLRAQLLATDPSVRMSLRKRPKAFTEQGVAMLSSVLNSERAVQVNITIMRAFVRLRAVLSRNQQLARRLESVERRLSRYDGRFAEHGRQIQAVFEAIERLLDADDEPGREIGFKPP